MPPRPGRCAGGRAVRAVPVCGLREDRTFCPKIRTGLALVARAGGGRSAELLRTEQIPCPRARCHPGGPRSPGTSPSPLGTHTGGRGVGRKGRDWLQSQRPLLSALGLQGGLRAALSEQPHSGRKGLHGRRQASPAGDGE